MTGIALLTEMTISYDRLHNEQEKIGQQINHSYSRASSQRHGGTYYQYTDQDFAEARQVYDRLVTPWDKFFIGLESVSHTNVAILSIQPDIKTGTLQIEGEAKDYAAVLTLVAQLRSRKPFSEVFLTRNEIKNDDPQHPIYFALTMHWGSPS